MKKQQGNIVLGLLVVALAVAGIVGYIMNIVKLFGIPSVDGHIGELVIRIIGVCTGIVGAIAGYV